MFTNTPWLVAVWATMALFASAAAALARESRRRPALHDGAHLALQHGPRGRRLIVWVAATSLLQAGAWSFGALASTTPTWARAVCVAAAVLFLLLAWHRWRRRAWIVHADDRRIAVVDHRGERRELPYADVRDVRLSPRLWGCLLRGANGTKLSFPGDLPGLPELLARLRQNVPTTRWRRWRGAVQSYQEAQREAEARR